MEYHDAEWSQHNDRVIAEPDNMEEWENLVRVTEALEGGLSKQSTPQHIAIFRDVYDRFLGKFPLFFGYWRKYADLEFAIAGSDRAELVLERAVSSCPMSIDLWTQYCSFKMDTSHDPGEIRELFERSLETVGLDFLAHPLWDKYLEYEERVERPENIWRILDRVVHVPLHQYARYFERYAQTSQQRPLSDLLPSDVLTAFRRELLQEPVEAVQVGQTKVRIERGELEVERELRIRVHHLQLETFNKTQTAVTRRWPYESEIRRAYFHVTELPAAELVNWRRYLDFEEQEGDPVRIIALYERCLHTCAMYDEFWLRYARWSTAHLGEDDTRNIYQRACQAVPISRPYLRYGFARWEEALGHIQTAEDLYSAVLLELPGTAETCVGRAHLERRQRGKEAAEQFLRNCLDQGDLDIYGQAILVAEWARILPTEEARQVFERYADDCLDSKYFWINFLRFELAQIDDAGGRGRSVLDRIVTQCRLSPAAVQDLTRIYTDWLLTHGTRELMMREYITLDVESEGPYSVRTIQKTRQGMLEQVERTNLSQNGHPGVHVNNPYDASCRDNEVYDRELRQQAGTAI
ncbi:hypothetical protein PYCC9005_002723 [Savitreella phatthalungensis]